VRECSENTRTTVLAAGRRISTIVVSAALRESGVDVHMHDWTWIEGTGRRRASATLELSANVAAARAHLTDSPGVHVVNGRTHAGSSAQATHSSVPALDLTTAVLACELDADAIEVLAEVPGIMSADPRAVPSAFPVRRLSYSEASELSQWSGSALDPSAIRLLSDRNIPLLVHRAGESEDAGTLVSRERAPSHPVQGFASAERVALIRLEGPALRRASAVGRIFSATLGVSGSLLFAVHGSSDSSTSLAVRHERVPTVLDALSEEFRLECASGEIERVRVEQDLSIVAVVGEGIGRRPGVSARAFAALAEHGISANATHHSPSELTLLFAVSTSERVHALRALHDAFY
ncbi:MAG: ACT domain-containing protein, partial [Steroidobacteraceae bacterium]